MLRLPLSHEEIERETCIIEQIAKKNDLQVNIRQLIHRKSLRNILSSSSSSTEFSQFISQHVYPSLPQETSVPPSNSFRPWVRLPLLGPDSYSLAREIKRYGYQIAFYPLTQIKNLSTLKDPVLKMDKPGIYQLECSCGDIYVGQSGRTISERLKEHTRDYKNLPRPNRKYQ